LKSEEDVRAVLSFSADPVKAEPVGLMVKVSVVSVVTTLFERMLQDAPVYPALQVQRPVPKLQTPRPEQYSYSIISSVAVLPSVMAQATSVPVTDEMSHVNDVKAGLPVWLCRLFSIGYSGQEVKVTVYGAPPFAVVPLVHVAASTLSRFVNAVVHAVLSVLPGAAFMEVV
jgi:hypothetical protein